MRMTKTEIKKKKIFETLLSQYFEFSAPAVTDHFTRRWTERFRTKHPNELFNIMERSEVVLHGSKFELYDPETNIRMTYEYKNNGKVVFITLFSLNEEFRDNWLKQAGGVE